MQVAFHSVRRKRLSMTSLIDVIFLLLLFFMLSSVFSRHVQIEVRAGMPAATMQEQPRARLLTVAPDSLLLNGKPVDPDLLREALTLPEGRQTSAVVISVSPGTDAQRLSTILLSLEGIDGLSVLLSR